MHSIKPIIAIAVSSSLLTGCMYVGGSVEDCPEIEAPISGVVPLDASSRRIAILPVTDELTQTTDNGPALALQSEISAIASGRGMELLDESNNDELAERIQLIDSGGTTKSRVNESIEVLKGAITNANLTFRFQEAETVTTGDEADTKPAYCIFTARIVAEARLYSGSPLQHSLTLPFNGVHQRQVETDDSTCAAEAELYNEMYRLAAVDAANELAGMARTRDLFNEESYVREVRMCFQKKYANFIWLSTAPGDVSKKGTRVNIYRQYWFKDKLKNKVMIRRTLVASGKITKSNNDGEVWVKVSGRNTARKIMLGDIAILDK